jgi:hypothetical protein
MDGDLKRQRQIGVTNCQNRSAVFFLGGGASLDVDAFVPRINAATNKDDQCDSFEYSSPRE